MASEPFADTDRSIREFYEAQRRMGRNPSTIDALAQRRFGRGVVSGLPQAPVDGGPGFGQTGVQRAMSAPGEPEQAPGPVAPDAPMGRADEGIEPLADVTDAVAGVAGMGAGAAYGALVDIPSAGANALGINLFNQGDARELSSAHDEWQSTVIDPISSMALQAGIDPSLISSLAQNDESWWDGSRGAVNRKFVNFGLLSADDQRGDFQLRKSPFLVGIRNLMTASSGKDIDPLDLLDPIQQQAALKSFERAAGAKGRIIDDKLENDPITQQIYDMEMMVKQLDREDKTFLQDAENDFKQLRNDTFHLVAEALGATEIQAEYQRLANQGYFGRTGARASQAFQTGRGLTAGIVSLPIVAWNNPSLVQRKPVLSGMMLLPFLKGGKGATNRVMGVLREQAAKGDSAAAAIVAKADALAGVRVPALRVRDLEVAASPEARTGPAVRPMEVRDLGGIATGAMATLPFGVPEVGAAYGAGGALARGTLGRLAPRFGQDAARESARGMAGEVSSIFDKLEESVIRQEDMDARGARERRTTLEEPEYPVQVGEAPIEGALGQTEPVIGTPDVRPGPARMDFHQGSVYDQASLNLRKNNIRNIVTALRDRMKLDPNEFIGSGIYRDGKYVEYFPAKEFKPLEILADDSPQLKARQTSFLKRQRDIIAATLAERLEADFQFGVKSSADPRGGPVGFRTRESILMDYAEKKGLLKEAEAPTYKSDFDVGGELSTFDPSDLNPGLFRDLGFLPETINEFFDGIGDKEVRTETVRRAATDLFDDLVDQAMAEAKADGLGDYVYLPDKNKTGKFYREPPSGPKWQTVQWINDTVSTETARKFGLNDGVLHENVRMDGSIRANSPLAKALEESGMPEQLYFETPERPGARYVPEASKDSSFERSVDPFRVTEEMLNDPQRYGAVGGGLDKQGQPVLYYGRETVPKGKAKAVPEMVERKLDPKTGEPWRDAQGELIGPQLVQKTYSTRQAKGVQGPEALIVEVGEKRPGVATSGVDKVSQKSNLPADILPGETVAMARFRHLRANRGKPTKRRGTELTPKEMAVGSSLVRSIESRIGKGELSRRAFREKKKNGKIVEDRDGNPVMEEYVIREPELVEAFRDIENARRIAADKVAAKEFYQPFSPTALEGKGLNWVSEKYLKFKAKDADFDALRKDGEKLTPRERTLEKNRFERLRLVEVKDGTYPSIPLAKAPHIPSGTKPSPTGKKLSATEMRGDPVLDPGYYAWDPVTESLINIDSYKAFDNPVELVSRARELATTDPLTSGKGTASAAYRSSFINKDKKTGKLASKTGSERIVELTEIQSQRPLTASEVADLQTLRRAEMKASGVKVQSKGTTKPLSEAQQVTRKDKILKGLDAALRNKQAQVYSAVGGLLVMGKRSESTRRAAGRKGWSAKHRKPIEDAPAYNVGKSMANWLTLALGRGSIEGSMKASTRLRRSSWGKSGNQARINVTDSGVRSVKNSIGDALQAIGRAIYQDGEFIEAIQAIDDLRTGSRAAEGVLAAIEESVYSGGEGISVGIGTKGVRNLYTETSFVMPESRLATHLTLTDLVGLNSALVALREAAVKKAIKGTAFDPISNKASIKNNPYREAYTRLAEQPFAKGLQKLSADQLNKLKSDIKDYQDRNIHKGKTPQVIKLPESVQKKLKDYTQVEYDALYTVIDRAKESALSRSLQRHESVFKEQIRQTKLRETSGDAYKSKPIDQSRESQLKILDQTVMDEGLTPQTPFEILSELEQRPLSDQILDSYDARPGKPIRVGPDTQVVRPDSKVSVDPFINTLIDRQSRRLSQLTDIPAGNIKIALTRMVREVFERGKGMLASSDLQGAVKQLALRKMKEEAKSKHGVIMDQGLVDQASTALDQVMSRFDRPFRLVDPKEITTLQSMGLTDVVQKVGVKGGSDVKVTIPLEPLFNEALESVRRSKHITESEIASQAAMKITKMLSDEARQAAYFKALRNDASRINVAPERLIEANQLLSRQDLSPSDRAYVRQSLFDTGLEMVGSVFGRYENTIGGLGISKAARNELQSVLRSSPKDVIKTIEGQRGRKLTDAQKRELVGEGGNAIQANSLVGEYLSWLDSWTEIGDIQIRSPFTNKAQRLSDADIASIRREIFPENSMLNQSLESTFKDSDYLVSPEWNRTQGFELVSRAEMDNLSSLLSRNNEGISKFLLSFHRHTKGALTTLNPVTHVGNFMSNVAAVSMLTGKNPLWVIKDTVTQGYLFNKLNTLKREGRKGDIKKFQEKHPEAYKDFEQLRSLGVRLDQLSRYELAGLTEMLGDTSLTKRMNREFGKLGRAPVESGNFGRFMTGFAEGVTKAQKAARRGAVKAYNLGDVSFRVAEFRRELGEMRRGVDRLRIGDKSNPSYIDLRTGPNTYTRIYKEGMPGSPSYKMWAKGKWREVSAGEMQTRMSKAALRKVNQIIFDYGDIPNFLRFIRDMPLSPIFSPFVTWAYKSLDIPGVKRGMIANTLFESPGYLSNDPAILSMQQRRMLMRDARRSALLGSLTSVRDTQDEISSKLGSYLNQVTGFDMGLVMSTQRPGVVSTWNTANMDPYSTTTSLFRTSAGLLAAMISRPEGLLTRKEISTLSKRDQFYQKLKKAHMGGYLLSHRDLASLLYMGGSPAGQIGVALIYGKPAQRPGPVEAGDIIKPLGEMIMGPALFRALGDSATAVIDPMAERGNPLTKVLSQVAPGRRRFIEQEKRIGSLPFEYGENYSPEKQLADVYSWWLESILYLGSRRRDYPILVEQLLKKEKSRLRANIAAPFERRMKNASSDKERRRLEEAMGTSLEVFNEVIERKVSETHKMAEGLARKDKRSYLARKAK